MLTHNAVLGVTTYILSRPYHIGEMGLDQESMIDTLRQPEYIGSNRCSACTVVNCCLAVTIAAAVTVISPLLGGVIFIFSLGMIYLRGYLIPGTPALTKQYFPVGLLRAFGKAPDTTGVSINKEGSQMDTSRSQSTIEGTDLLVDCPERDDICLEPDFRRAWEEAITEIRNDNHRQQKLLADMLQTNIDPSAVSFQEGNRELTATLEQKTVGKWRSRAAFLADVAAAAVIADWDPNWRQQSVQTKGNKLARLRIFLESCPSCGGSTTFQTDEGHACCWSREVTAVRCVECDAPIIKVDELALDTGSTTYI